MPQGFIVAYNYINSYGSSGGNTPLDFGGYSNYVSGAIVQNVIEYTNSTSLAQLWVGADTSLANMTNIIIWNNSISGDRCNQCYANSASGTGLNSVHLLNSVRGNDFEQVNIKTDNFTSTPNTNNTNNWSQVWGCGWAYNYSNESTGIGAAGAFNNTFFGYPGFQWVTPQAFTVSGWVDRESQTGGVVGTGNGNYRLKSDSTVTRPDLSGWWGIPFDIEGNARSALSPPGAYASASPRKGASFLGF